jgi:hypothetical protein
MSKRYRVMVGLDYPPGKRAEPGDVVDNLPTKSVKWLLSSGKIEPVPFPGKPAPETEED